MRQRKNENWFIVCDDFITNKEICIRKDNAGVIPTCEESELVSSSMYTYSFKKSLNEIQDSCDKAEIYKVVKNPEFNTKKKSKIIIKEFQCWKSNASKCFVNKRYEKVIHKFANGDFYIGHIGKYKTPVIINKYKDEINFVLSGLNETLHKNLWDEVNQA